MSARGANSSGVKQLLEAEKRAAELVEEARRKKVATMKRAQSEAKEEIQKFRAEKDSEFRGQAQTDVGSSNDDTAAINQDTDLKMAALKESVVAHENEVIHTLVDIVCNIKMVVHENYIRPQQA